MLRRRRLLLPRCPGRPPPPPPPPPNQPVPRHAPAALQFLAGTLTVQSCAVRVRACPSSRLSFSKKKQQILLLPRDPQNSECYRSFCSCFLFPCFGRAYICSEKSRGEDRNSGGRHVFQQNPVQRPAQGFQTEVSEDLNEKKIKIRVDPYRVSHLRMAGTRRRMTNVDQYRKTRLGGPRFVGTYTYKFTVRVLEQVCTDTRVVGTLLRSLLRSTTRGLFDTVSLFFFFFFQKHTEIVYRPLSAYPEPECCLRKTKDLSPLQAPIIFHYNDIPMLRVSTDY